MGSSIRSVTVPLNPQWKPAYDPADSCIRPHCAPIGIIGVICLTVSGFADRGQDVPERVRICRPQAGEGGGWVFWLDVWFVLYLGLIGLVVGSFLNVVVWRLPGRRLPVRSADAVWRRGTSSPYYPGCSCAAAAGIAAPRSRCATRWSKRSPVCCSRGSGSGTGCPCPSWSRWRLRSS